MVVSSSQLSLGFPASEGNCNTPCWSHVVIPVHFIFHSQGLTKQVPPPIPPMLRTPRGLLFCISTSAHFASRVDPVKSDFPSFPGWSFQQARRLNSLLGQRLNPIWLHSYNQQSATLTAQNFVITKDTAQHKRNHKNKENCSHLNDQLTKDLRIKMARAKMRSVRPPAH